MEGLGLKGVPRAGRCGRPFGVRGRVVHVQAQFDQPSYNSNHSDAFMQRSGIWNMRPNLNEGGAPARPPDKSSSGASLVIEIPFRNRFGTNYTED